MGIPTETIRCERCKDLTEIDWGDGTKLCGRCWYVTRYDSRKAAEDKFAPATEVGGASSSLNQK